MRFETRQFDNGEGGTVSGLIAYPGGAASHHVSGVILAHGAGGDMHNPLLSHVHQGLARAGAVTVKFNFPYRERGSRLPDPAPRLEACFRSVVDDIRSDNDPHVNRLFLGGKSLGGRMASHLAAQGVPVNGLIFLGYPLHPAGKPEKARVAHLPAIHAPMLFFAGTRDPLCNLDLLKRTLDSLRAPIDLHVIAGADHSFEVPKRSGRSAEEIHAEITEYTAKWMRTAAS